VSARHSDHALGCHCGHAGPAPQYVRGPSPTRDLRGSGKAQRPVSRATQTRSSAPARKASRSGQLAALLSIASFWKPIEYDLGDDQALDRATLATLNVSADRIALTMFDQCPAAAPHSPASLNSNCQCGCCGVPSPPSITSKSVMCHFFRFFGSVAYAGMTAVEIPAAHMN
jgi:hypothetical protein